MQKDDFVTITKLNILFKNVLNEHVRWMVLDRKRV